MKKRMEGNPDDALFVALQKSKKRRRRKILFTTLAIIFVILAAAIIAIFYLRGRVENKFSQGKSEVLTYAAQIGSVSTTVSGEGILEDVDLEELSVPANVSVDEIVVEAQEKVEKGDIIAYLDLSSVLSAMSEVQAQLDDFDKQLSDAEDDAVSEKITAGVAGRVKAIYCAEGDTVAQCMYSNGALMLLSADGYMAAEIEAGSLKKGDQLTATLPDGTEEKATVSLMIGETATILLDDETLIEGDTISLTDADGKTLGSAEVTIHNPLRVTGFAGTVEKVHVEVGDKVKASTTVLTLSDTEYSANYEAILRQREEAEDTLMELLTLYHDGALLSPISGSVSSVTDLDAEDTEADMYYAQESEDQLIAVISPDQQMKISISVDETDILSLEPDQKVEITISSLGEDTFEGIVSEVDKSADSSSGVTSYSAEILLDKQEKMLAGMNAEAVIRIQGVEDAIIIPVDALHQTSASSFVYTSYDEEKGEYGGMKEVTTGLTGSNYVEITSGLSEGDVVYYTEQKSNNPWGNFSGFGSMPSGGTMPSGGFGRNMPSGGFEMPSGGRGGSSSGGKMPGGGGNMPGRGGN